MAGAKVHDSLRIPTSFPILNGSSSMVRFENGGGAERPLFQTEEACDEDCLRPGKKQRLSGDQVRFLEKSFEAEHRLKPARKVKLAEEMGLQPRQVAIWFQNRRARSKTKRLEVDHESLRSSFDKLRSGYDDLVKETEKLKQEALFFKDKLLINEQEHLHNIVSENGSDPGDVVPVTWACNKQEDTSSAKSDVLNSDSSNVFESEEDDNYNHIFSTSFLSAASPPSYLSELGDQLGSFWS